MQGLCGFWASVSAGRGSKASGAPEAIRGPRGAHHASQPRWCESPAPPRIRRPHTGRPEGLCAVVPGSVSYTPGTPARPAPYVPVDSTGHDWAEQTVRGHPQWLRTPSRPRIVDHLVYDAPVAALVAVTEGSAQEGVVALGEVVLGSARCRGGGVVVSRLRPLARVLVVADGDAQVPLGVHGRAVQDPVVRLGEPGVSTAVKTLSDHCREDALRRSAETAAAARLGRGARAVSGRHRGPGNKQEEDHAS